VNVGQNVKRLRKEQRYTQTEIARRCGVTPAAISGLEYGDFTPSTALVVKIARALDVEPGELLKEQATAFKAVAPQPEEEPAAGRTIRVVTTDSAAATDDAVTVTVTVDELAAAINAVAAQELSADEAMERLLVPA
jgi:transcriptional regulator with XRE-family HTH domain